jgi:cystathionine beta-lyase family protein involved in aluminum resistance
MGATETSATSRSASRSNSRRAQTAYAKRDQEEARFLDRHADQERHRQRNLVAAHDQQAADHHHQFRSTALGRDDAGRDHRAGVPVSGAAKVTIVLTNVSSVDLQIGGHCDPPTASCRRRVRPQL